MTNDQHNSHLLKARCLNFDFGTRPKAESRAACMQSPAAPKAPRVSRRPKPAKDSIWDDPVVGAIAYVVGWLLGIMIAMHFSQ